MKMLKLHKSLLLLLVAITLNGCIDMVYDGSRLAKDKATKQVWKYLANDGDVEAQYTLGVLYCCGERPYYDNIEALHWWCKAAKNGQRDAQFEIGKLYEKTHEYKGSIIPKDDVLAYVYYTIAAENGNVQAIEYRGSLKENLSEDELHKSEVLIKRWPIVYCETNR